MDSFLEYLVKGAALLGHSHLWSRFRGQSVCLSVSPSVCVCIAVMLTAELLPRLKVTLFNNWNLWVNMEKGTFTFAHFVALDGYWPGLLVRDGGARLSLSSSLALLLVIHIRMSLVTPDFTRKLTFVQFCLNLWCILYVHMLYSIGFCIHFHTEFIYFISIALLDDVVV